MLAKLGQKLLALLGEDERLSIDGNQIHVNQWRQVLEAYNLTDFLPYRSYDPKEGLFHNQHNLGFVLELTPLCGVEDKLLNDITAICEEVLLEGDYLQVMLWADPRVEPFLSAWSNPRHNHSSLMSKLASKREQHLLSANIAPRNFRVLLSYTTSAAEQDKESRRKCLDVKTRLMNMLKAYTGVKSWRANDLIQTLNGLLYPDLGINIKDKTWDPLQDLSSQIGEIGYKHNISKQAINFNDCLKGRTYSVSKWPGHWWQAAMSELLGSNDSEFARIRGNIYLHLAIYVPSQRQIIESFENNYKFLEMQGRSAKLLELIPSLRDELEDYQFTRRSLYSGRRLLKLHMSAGLVSPENELESNEQILTNLFRNQGFTLTANNHLHLPHYLGALPFMWHDGWQQEFGQKGLKFKTSLSSEPANLMPLQGEWKGTPSPGMILQALKGQLFNWHPFDNNSGNYNVVVVGKSGSGKSVFMQDLLVSTLSNKGKVFVLDMGRSFENTCKLLGGQFIEFGRTSEICLNPFTNIPQDQPARDEAFSMLKSVIALMAAPSDDLGDYDKAIIEKSIREVWKEHGNKATITDIAAWLSNMEDEKARRLGVMLTPYTKDGVYGRYFHGENNTNFNHSMVVIELDELKAKPELQGPVLQLFIMNITSQMLLGSREIEFHICMDEAWKLLAGKQMGSFIAELARCLRKYRGSLVTGTQSINDFYNTPGAMAAFENSDWLCFLSQKQESIESLKHNNRLSLDLNMETVLKSLSTSHGQYSEVMIYNPDYGYATGRLILDKFSELLYSTQASDYKWLRQLQRQGYDLGAAIEYILKERENE